MSKETSKEIERLLWNFAMAAGNYSDSSTANEELAEQLETAIQELASFLLKARGE